MAHGLLADRTGTQAESLKSGQTVPGEDLNPEILSAYRCAAQERHRQVHELIVTSQRCKASFLIVQELNVPVGGKMPQTLKGLSLFPFFSHDPFARSV